MNYRNSNNSNLFRLVGTIPLFVACSGGEALPEERISSTSEAITSTGTASNQKVWLAEVGMDTQAWFQTLPNAECSVGTAGQALIADDRGVVAFQVTPVSADVAAQLQFECTAPSGAVDKVALSIRAVKDHSSVSSNPPLPPVNGVFRGALKGNPRAYSQNQLKAGNYPPRPDPDAAPEDYKEWLDGVQRDVTVIASRQVPRQGHYHGPTKGSAIQAKKPRSTSNISQAAGNSTWNATSSVWSGWVANEYAVYNDVVGCWTVQSVNTNESYTTTMMSEWVGLDGWYNGIVVQAGVEQEVLTVLGFKLNQNYAWIEWYPNGEIPISSMSISVGDSLCVTVDGRSWSDGSEAAFTINNMSKSQVYSGTLNAPSTATRLPYDPAVDSAEAIVEAPNGGSYPLTDYYWSSMWGYALHGAKQYFGDGGYYYVDMYSASSGNLLSTGLAGGSSHYVNFNWENYQ